MTNCRTLPQFSPHPSPHLQQRQQLRQEAPDVLPHRPHEVRQLLERKLPQRLVGAARDGQEDGQDLWFFGGGL
jgi:hypothetical protein